MAAEVSAFIDEIKKRRDLGANVVHHHRIEAKEAKLAPIPPGVHPALAESLEKRGLEKLYSHQAEAATAAMSGENVIVATPTASGKTLCYTIPTLDAMLADPEATALYIFPLKALARDQLKSFNEMTDDVAFNLRADVFDGDTSPHARRRILASRPRVIFTNPDMLHLSILPYHAKWEEFFGRLKYIVVDETHTYRGVFGSHVAQVFRRLSRIAKRYGADPVFISCSATISNPGRFAGDLMGRPFTVVEESGAPRPGGHFVFYNTEGSPYTDASKIIRAAMKAGLKTIAFTKARKITELIYTWTIQAEPDIAGKLGVYRAGFLPEERRKIESALFSGRLDGVISTSALEMGVDIGGLDVCVLVGYPGTVINTWQRGGRVGRGEREFLIIMVALRDALDQHFIRNPEDFFTRGYEAAIIDPDNENILKAHLPLAAAELPIEMDDESFRPEGIRPIMDELERSRDIIFTLDEKRWVCPRKYPHRSVDIRSAGEGFTIFTEGGKKVIGSLSGSRVYSEGHVGAVYMHMGRQYIVKRLDLEKRAVHVEQMEERYYTRPRTEKETEILSVITEKEVNGFPVRLGRLKVTEQVTGYERRSIFGQETLGVFDLDMPRTEFETAGFWIEIDDDTRLEIETRGLKYMGGIHAFEHASISLFPLFALCDRDDIGGISYPHHPGLGKSAVFFYDGYPGGVGLCEAGYEKVEDLWEAALDLVAGCECGEGCPSCVHSPKCGSGNKPLDKAAAVMLMMIVLGKRERRGPRAQAPGTRVIPPGPAARQEEAPAPRLVEYYDPAPDRKIVFFDLETQLGADEVGGWDRADLMRMSVGVVYDSRQKRYVHYWEEDVPALIDELLAADLVVGFNQVRFDYAVLSGYTGRDLATEIKSFDILLDVWSRLGHRLSLDNLARGTLRAGKTADGLAALRWWKEGKRGLLAEYCEADVKITKEIFEYGLENQHLVYKLKKGESARLPLEWDLARIIEKAARPLPAVKRKLRF